MKNWLLTGFSLLLTAGLFAGNGTSSTDAASFTMPSLLPETRSFIQLTDGRFDAPMVFVGAEGGYNSCVGWGGLRGEARFGRKTDFSVMFGMGYGTWGWIMTGGLRYYPLGYPYKLAVGLNVVNHAGLSAEISDSALLVTNGSLTYPRDVNIDFLNATTLNLTVSYSQQLWKTPHKVYIEAGYGVVLQSDPYRINGIEPDESINSNTQSDIDARLPGGPVIGIGICFGFRPLPRGF